MRKKRAVKWLPSSLARAGYHWIPGVEGLRGKHGIRGIYIEIRKAMLLTKESETPLLMFLMNLDERREQAWRKHLIAPASFRHRHDKNDQCSITGALGRILYASCPLEE